MTTIKFFDSSDLNYVTFRNHISFITVREYINKVKTEVEDTFQMYYPDSECELKVDNRTFTTSMFLFEIIFKDNWSSPEDIDEEVIRDICQSNKLYCWILIDNKMNKGYFYDEDDEFVYR